MTNTPNNLRIHFTFGTAALVVVAWIVWPFLFQSQVPAFRDGFHFYWPQAVWLESAQQSGNYFPKWNFNEGLGASVTSQPTWQLYYPLRCLWFIPGLTLEQCNGLFLAVHLMLAGLGIYRTARSLKLNHPSSALAAVSYALCCPVLFQVNNLVYLCSATWVAWAMLPIIRLAIGSQDASEIKKPSEIKKHWAAFTLELVTLGSLMALSGDPHASVNFALLLLVAAAWRAVNWLRGRRYANRSNASATEHFDNVDGETRLVKCKEPNKSELTSFFARLWLATRFAVQIVVVGLAVWQSWLTLEWVAVSSRSSAPVEVRDSYNSAIHEILSANKKSPSQSQFDFSLSPWNLLSVAMPTWAGHFQPDNSRWVQAIPSEGRMWMPSMYQGFLPLIFALCALFVFWLPKRHTSIRNVLSAIAMFSLLAAMGNYSIAWVVRSLLQLAHLNDLAQLLPGDNSGSLYGLLTSIIPGYDSFRYPAKWSVWFAACIALLAGVGMNEWLGEQMTSSRFATRWLAKRVGYLSLAVTICMGTTIAIARVYREPIEEWLRTYPDPLAGYPNYEASFRAISQGFLHPLIFILVSLVAWKLWTYRRRALLQAMPTKISPNLDHGFAWNIVALTAVDLASLAPCWLTTIDSRNMSRLEIVESLPNQAIMRVWANTGRADVEMISQDAEPTMQDSLQLQREFLQGKMGLLVNVDALHTTGTIEPQATVILRRWLQQHDTLHPDQPEVDQVLAALAVSHRLVWQPKKQGSKLVWQRVQQARPLCELVMPGVLDPKKTNLQWRIENVDELVIEVQAETEAVLLIRQLNDGHWQLTDDQLQSYPIAPTELWVTGKINPGSHTFRLTRAR